MKNILVAIDFEPTTDQLIDFAAMLADKFSSKIWILHIAAPDPDFVGYEVGPKSVRDSRAKELRKEHQLIQRYAHKLESMNLIAESLLIEGPTIETILEKAENLNIDLIILGSHKHSFLYRLFHEIVSSGIVKKSKIPVLTLPAD